MMYTLKGRYATAATILLFALLCHGDLFGHARQQQRHDIAIPPLAWHLALPWKYMLREIILKSSLDIDAPRARPLEIASYYGGPPAAAHSNDDANVVLSRGNIYRLLNGYWMLCQDGCVDCEPCATLRNPLFEWTLRKVRRLPAADPPRHDLQLTIMPQADERLHASNPWPNSYVYVTSRDERAPFSVDRAQHDDQNSTSGLENSFSGRHHRSKNPRRLAERDSIASRSDIPRQDDRATVLESAKIEKEAESSAEQRRKSKNTRQYRPRPKPTDKPVTTTSTAFSSIDVTVYDEDEENQLPPTLILGTDQQGQKHLIHVVPADHPPTTALPATTPGPNRPVSSQLVAGQAAHSNKTVPKREQQTYERIFRRVFDSLNTHRRSIEDFLSVSPTNNGRGIPPSSENNMKTVGSSWNDRDTNRVARVNFDMSPFYAGNDDRMEKRQRYRSGYDYEDLMRNVDNVYSGYQDVVKALRSQESTGLDWDRERKVRVVPYFINSAGRNIPRTNSSRSSNNSLVNAVAKSGISGFIAAKQIDLNDTVIDEAIVSGNHPVESSSIMTDREDLFNPRRLKSGDANREPVVSRYPFRIIVTTESPVIRREHETLNRITGAIQITTSKTLTDNHQ